MIGECCKPALPPTLPGFLTGSIPRVVKGQHHNYPVLCKKASDGYWGRFAATILPSMRVQVAGSFCYQS